MELNQNKPGYWRGMHVRLKAKLLGWLMYWALALWLASLGSLIGYAMLTLPAFWFIAKAWLFDSFLELDTDNGDSVLDYTLGHIWNSSIYMRSVFLVIVLGVTLGGLGWLGTKDLREERAQLSLTERVSDTTGSVTEAIAENTGAAADATKETTKRWIATVKGWFGGGDAPSK